VLIVIAAALFFWLKSGIDVDQLSVGDYRVEKLYIKLNKKLTLKADHITLPESKASPGLGNIDQIFDRIKYLLSFFDYIELKKVDFNNNRIDVIYTDNILYLTTNDYEIAGNIVRQGRVFNANVSMLYLKKHGINIVGNLHYDLDRHSLKTDGTFDAFGIDGNFTATKEDSLIGFEIATEPFNDLRPVIDLFSKMHPTVKSWIVDRIRGKHYTLYTLSGQGKLDHEGKFKLDIDSLRGEALVEDVKIYFQKKLDPVTAKRLHVHYYDGALFFGVDAPKYKKVDLNGSKISILGLAARKAHLKLDLKLKAPVDKEVQKILKSYKINLPIRYTGKYADVKLRIDVPLKRRQKNEKPKVKVAVRLDLKKGLASYGQITLPIQNGWVEYNNTKQYPLKSEAVLSRGDVRIGEIVLPVLGGSLKYSKEKIYLHKTHLKMPWMDAIVKGEIDLLKKLAKLIAEIQALKIGEKTKYVVLRNKSVPLSLDFSNGIEIDIPTLYTKISQTKEGLLISVKNLGKLKPYLRAIPIDFENGELNVSTEDMKHYRLEGRLKSNVCFFYGKQGSCYTQLPLAADITPKRVLVEAFDKRLRYDTNKGRIDLERLNIDLKKLLNVYLAKSKQGNTVAKNKLTEKKSLIIIGKKSDIRYGEHTLVTDSYDITIKPNGDIKALGSTDGNIVKFDKNGKMFKLKALRVTDKLLHPLISFKGLHGGRYSVSMEGNPDLEMKGRIIFEGGVLSGFRAYNNTLAFINTLPALATLQRPGFSKQGFKIKSGVINYRQRRDRIILDSIYIKGSAATIAGKGVIDLKHKQLNVSLAIQTARELGKIVGKIPLLGYIVMGKDKSLTIGLKITGSIDHPKVKTSAAKEILSLPLDILKRTLESPAHLIGQ